MKLANRVTTRLLLIAIACGTLTFSLAAPARASGCTVPPCGALTNHSSTGIAVKWSDDDSTWNYATVSPGTTKGGWYNDGIDVDYFNVPPRCSASGGIGGASYTWYSGWNKIKSHQTVVVKSMNCNGGGI